MSTTQLFTYGRQGNSLNTRANRATRTRKHVVPRLLTREMAFQLVPRLITLVPFETRTPSCSLVPLLFNSYQVFLTRAMAFLTRAMAF